MGKKIADVVLCIIEFGMSLVSIVLGGCLFSIPWMVVNAVYSTDSVEWLFWNATALVCTTVLTVAAILCYDRCRLSVTQKHD